MWFWKITALGFAGILDLAAGLFIVHVLSIFFAHPLVWWQYAIGAFLGASPDIDLFYAFWKKNATGHHDYLTHRPIIGVTLAITLGWFWGGTFWAIAAGVGVFWHYLHDTDGFLGLSGGGIAWLWPFSEKYLGMRGLNAQVVSWTSQTYKGDEGNDCDDIYKTYLIATQRSVTEFLLTGVLVGYVVGSLFGYGFGCALAALFWLTVQGLWTVRRQLVQR
jgi:hypothetical protein